jgi:hypothetical protein
VIDDLIKSMFGDQNIIVKKTITPLSVNLPPVICIKNSEAMISAFTKGLDYYMPVIANKYGAHTHIDAAALKTEGGISENSYQNLKKVMRLLGRPFCVERAENGNVLAHFKDGCYLATGFDCGYLGTGPYYFARFAEDAGFGEADELYMELSKKDRQFAGIMWGIK